MANPLLVANPPVTFPRGPGQATDNLTNLANGQAKGMGSVGTAQVQYYDDNIAPIWIRSGAAVSGTGTVSAYLIIGEDGTHWTGGVDPVTTADQSVLISVLNPILPNIVITLPNTTYYFPEFSVRQLLRGFMPTFWGVAIYNLSGGALSSVNTNFYAQHSLIQYA